MIRNSLFATIIILLVMLITSAVGHATILPGNGIAGVRIGASMARVRALLGQPDSVVPPAWLYGAPLRGRVGFDHRREVNDVSTKSRRQRTRKGIGPGSSPKAMHNAYPNARCHARNERQSICILTSRSDGQTVKTDFLFRGRRLQEVDVYLVLPAVPPGPE